MVRARKYIMVKQFSGEPKRSDLQIVEEELSQIKNGEYLCKATYLSVDPYMRPYMSQYLEGTMMIGDQVAEIVESKNKNFPVGKFVVGSFGWRDYTIGDGKALENPITVDPYVLMDIGTLPVSLSLGALGMPGNTAYFGFIKLCQPKAGETVVITGAAGGVGSHVGQIAKIKGCKVIGFAGSEIKCKWLKDNMGFDYAFNYKTVNADRALKECAPKGIDCYFDNVGGELSSVIFNNMNRFGRISICGAMSIFNTEKYTIPNVPAVQPSFLASQLKMEGFVVSRWSSSWKEGIEENLRWIKEGKLKYQETMTDGFENMYDAFVGMLRGENVGKALVKV